MGEPVEGGRHRRKTDDGGEDVLAVTPGEFGEPKHATRPRARRSPWNRPRDRVISVAVAVAVAGSGVFVWLTSDSRATVSQTTDLPATPVPMGADSVPGSIGEVWQLASSATPEPVVASNTVVTADKGEVDGRDALTGQIRWRYSRDLPLCTVDTVWGRVNAVYRRDTGCSEVTQLDPDTGRRTAQRNGDAELGTRLVTDGTYVTTTGKQLLDTWRDDLVQTMEYGKVPFLVNPDKQPRTGCTYGSVAAASSKVGVIERCQGDPADRLTVYQATNDQADTPKVPYSSVLAGRSAKLVAMSGDLAAVALPDLNMLVIYSGDGTERASYPLNLPSADLSHDPPDGVMDTAAAGRNIYWYTGSKTFALSRETLAPVWSVDSTLGPGTLYEGQLVLPFKGGIEVLDENNGSTIRTVGVDRHGYTGPVRLASMGELLLEQRGPNLAALR